MTETEAKIISEMSQCKELLIHFAQMENWDRVSQLVEELKILKSKRLSILESRRKGREYVSCNRK